MCCYDGLQAYMGAVGMAGFKNVIKTQSELQSPSHHDNSNMDTCHTMTPAATTMQNLEVSTPYQMLEAEERVATALKQQQVERLEC